MTQDDVGCAAGVGCFVLLAFGVVLAFVCWFGPISCANRWPDTEHRWEVVGGCIVRTPSGDWVTEDSFRVIRP